MPTALRTLPSRLSLKPTSTHWQAKSKATVDGIVRDGSSLISVLPSFTNEGVLIRYGRDYILLVVLVVSPGNLKTLLCCIDDL